MKYIEIKTISNEEQARYVESFKVAQAKIGIKGATFQVPSFLFRIADIGDKGQIKRFPSRSIWLVGANIDEPNEIIGAITFAYNENRLSIFDYEDESSLKEKFPESFNGKTIVFQM